MALMADIHTKGSGCLGFRGFGVSGLGFRFQGRELNLAVQAGLLDHGCLML